MPREQITWACETCDGQPTFDHDEFVKHAQTVHGLAKDAKGKRSMMMHADGAKFFSTIYRWEFDNFSAQQKITTQRTGADAAFWEDAG